MPTLGFLKKIRTKDSSGSRDLTSPTSPVGISPVVSASSNYQSLEPSVTNSSYTSFQSHTTQQSETTAANQTPNSHGLTHQPIPTSAPNNAGVSQPETQSTQPNTKNPENSVQSTHTEGSGQSEMEARANGGFSKDRQATGNHSGGSTPAVRTTKGKYSLSDFLIQRTLGTGSFGRVHLVQSKHNQRFYAVKVLKKQQVVKMKQVEHTNDERRMLQKVKHPFLVTLWGTFQDSKNLYMVMDFVEGGELFSLLRKSQVSGISFAY